MKTAIKTVNQLKHTINVNNNTGNYKIEIRLSDDCKNGHNDFAITATFWEIGRVRSDRNLETAGCCHDEILKVHPELKIFVDLHLSDVKGAPLYAAENGYYWLRKDIKTAKEYLRVDDAEIEALRASTGEFGFSFKLHEIGIVKRWEQEAQAAIKELEALTGNKFKDDSTKFQKIHGID